MPQPNAPSNGHSDSAVCGVICTTGRNGEPLACGFTVGHEGDHSWASQPTWVDGIDPESVAAAAEWLAKQKVSPKAAKDQWTNAAAAIRHGLSEGLIRRKAGRPVMGEPDRTPNGRSERDMCAALERIADLDEEYGEATYAGQIAREALGRAPWPEGEPTDV